MNYYLVNSNCHRFPQMVTPGRSLFARNNADVHGFCLYLYLYANLCLLQISLLNPLTSQVTVELSYIHYAPHICGPLAVSHAHCGHRLCGCCLCLRSSGIHREVTSLCFPPILLPIITYLNPEIALFLPWS